MVKSLKIILTKSKIGRTEKVRATLLGIGLTRHNNSVFRKDSPELRGMLRKVQHLIRVEEISC